MQERVEGDQNTVRSFLSTIQKERYSTTAQRQPQIHLFAHPALEGAAQEVRRVRREEVVVEHLKGEAIEQQLNSANESTEAVIEHRGQRQSHSQKARCSA